MKVIVFSKDRALQLDAFLRSYVDHVKPAEQVHVLYRATSERHRAAYEELFRTTTTAVPHAQGDSFKEDLLTLLCGGTNVVFFVDDQLFIRPWMVLEEPGLSLRLGLNLTCDYNSSLYVQPLPKFVSKSDMEVLSWRWAEGIGAWGYPLSLDGHVFELDELRTMVSQVHFRSPNTLEHALQGFIHMFSHRFGICYTLSKTVNIPWNQVQTDWNNRHADGNDAEKMLGYWEAGSRISVRWLYDTMNESTHQEYPLVLEDAA